MRGYGAGSYGDGFADVYDDWYAQITDVQGCTRVVTGLARAVAATRDAPVVLELGIGTGRLALPLQAAGLDVRGIDASTSMLEVLRAKPGGDLPVHVGDFRDVAVPRRDGEASAPPVDVVLVACNTLFNLDGRAAQQDCLSGVATVLATDGRLVVEAFVPPDADVEDRGGRPEDAVRVRDLAADRLVLTATVHDRSAQSLAGQVVDIGPDGIALRPWVVHYLFPQQLDRLAAAAGLVLEHRWADWDATPFDAAATSHVSTYRAVEPSPAGPPPDARGAQR